MSQISMKQRSDLKTGMTMNDMPVNVQKHVDNLTIDKNHTHKTKDTEISIEE